MPSAGPTSVCCGFRAAHRDVTDAEIFEKLFG
jgi:hypothetical protein